MQRIAILCLFFAGVFAISADVSAQTGDETVVASSAVQDARAARERGDFDTALSRLEAALHAEPNNGLILYERILTLEAMGELELALQIISDRRDIIIKHPEVNDLAVVEQRLISARDAAATGPDSGSDPTETNDANSDGEGGNNAVSDADTDTDTGSDTDMDEGPASEPGSSNVGAVIALAAGGTAMIAGSVLLLLANADAADLACAGISPDPGCSVDELQPNVTRAEYSDRQSSITTRRIVGGVAVGLGAVAVGWGIYDLLSSDSEAANEASGSADSGVKPGFGVSDRGFSIGLSGRF